jgi:hypothetical protein
MPALEHDAQGFLVGEIIKTNNRPDAPLPAT